MRVEVLFKSHRYEEFDSSTQTCAEPYRNEGCAILIEWNLYLGELETKGVILTQHWYNRDNRSPATANSVLIDGVRVPVASRKIGCAMLLVGADELADIVWLKKDGEKVLWREGNDLINGERFFAMEQLCYSDAVTKSINRRAISVFEYLHHAHPEWSNEEVARNMGYTAAAIERIRDVELAQEEGYLEEDDSEETGVIEEAAEEFDFF